MTGVEPTPGSCRLLWWDVALFPAAGGQSFPVINYDLGSEVRGVGRGGVEALR